MECSKETMKELHGVIGREEKEVEISEYMTKLTADIIARTGFDNSYDMGEKILHLLERMKDLTAEASRHLWFPGNRFNS